MKDDHQNETQEIDCPVGNFRVPIGKQLPYRLSGSNTCLVPEDCMLSYEGGACLTEGECRLRLDAVKNTPTPLPLETGR